MTGNKALITGRHYPALDGLRALAILLVMWVHTFTVLPQAVPVSDAVYSVSMLGACGVSLFFVLSGFLITGILMDTADDPHVFRKFYIRRVLRIFPLYYVGLSILLIISVLYNKNLDIGEHVYPYVFYLHNMEGIIFGEKNSFGAQGWRFLDHFWSLAVEEQFYLIWPVVFLFLYRRTSVKVIALVILSLIVSSAAVRYAMTLDGTWIHAHISTFSRADALLLGGLAAYLMKEKNQVFLSLQSVSGLFILTCLAMSLYLLLLSAVVDVQELFLMYARYLILLSNVFFFFLLLSVAGRPAEHNLFQKVMCSSFMKEIARVSYGMYVYHMIVFWVVQKYLFMAVPKVYHVLLPVLIFIVGGTTVYCIAFFSYRFFEKPILDLKEKYAPIGRQGRDG